LDATTGDLLADLSGAGGDEEAGFLTGAVEHAGYLYLGSLRRSRWGRIRLGPNVL
jgi:hypothetical protein